MGKLARRLVREGGLTLRTVVQVLHQDQRKRQHVKVREEDLASLLIEGAMQTRSQQERNLDTGLVLLLSGKFESTKSQQIYCSESFLLRVLYVYPL